MARYESFKYNQGINQQGCVRGCCCCRCVQSGGGITGPTGPQGIQGPQGEAGLQGVQGIQGVPGLRGLQGPTGADGTNVTILGSYDSPEELVKEHPTGNAGDSYLIGGRLYVWDMLTGTWKNVGRIQGPDGPEGPQGAPGQQGALGPTGPEGPQGITGPVASTIPFSLSKYGVYLTTDSRGQPLNVAFSGFGSAGYTSEYLQEGEWESGKITIREDMEFGTVFIIPHSGTLKKLYFVFSMESAATYGEGITVRPFICIGISNQDELVYEILQDTITFAEPYNGGVEHTKHTLRRGSNVNLNVELTEGTLVAIIAGMIADNATESQYGTFSASGGLYIQ